MWVASRPLLHAILFHLLFFLPIYWFPIEYLNKFLMNFYEILSPKGVDAVLNYPIHPNTILSIVPIFDFIQIQTLTPTANWLLLNKKKNE